MYFLVLWRCFFEVLGIAFLCFGFFAFLHGPVSGQHGCLQGFIGYGVKRVFVFLQLRFSALQQAAALLFQAPAASLSILA